MNLDGVQNEGENFSSQEYDKYRTVQHKKRKGALPKIASTAKMNTSEAEFSDDTSSIEKEEGVNDIKYDKIKNLTRIKSQNAQRTLPVLRWRKV